jgi:hypothetical protein
VVSVILVTAFNHDFVLYALDARVSYRKVKLKDIEALMTRFLRVF